MSYVSITDGLLRGEKIKIKSNSINASPNYFELINSSNLLDHNETEIKDTDNTRNISFSTTAEFNNKIKNKSKVYVNQFPDHDVLRRKMC